MKEIIFGMAVGDALGVPYEFITKGEMSLMPCKDMVGYGTHNQPVGTWSDDTSMALCIIESLCNGLNYTNIADKFKFWLFKNLWTPHGYVFDAGSSTGNAINRWRSGKYLPTECGGLSFSSNGNGSVMRTLVLVPFIENMDVYKRYDVVSNVSSITHAHWISTFSCFLVCEYAIAIRKGYSKLNAFTVAVESLNLINNLEISKGGFSDLTEDEFKKHFQTKIDLIKDENSTDVNFHGFGFALDTAITSIWCIMTTENFKEATLKAVNYGYDTDTTGCVTGGLAGIVYGYDGIPEEWLVDIARKDDINELVENYDSVYENA